MSAAPSPPPVSASAVYACSACGYCVDGAWPARGLDGPCAAWNHHARTESVTGRGYMAIGRALLDGAVLPDADLAAAAFACTQCGACASACPVGLTPHALARALRADLVTRGGAPDAADAVRRAVLGTGNPWGEAPEAREAWAAGLPEPSGAQYLLWPGCAGAHHAPAEVRAAYLLLRRAGLAVGYVQGEPCCGAPLHELGCDADAAALGAALAGPLRDTGAAVVSVGAPCTAALRRAGIEARPFIAVLADAVRAGALRLHPHPGAPARVAVLDACGHARGADADLPARVRELLAAMQCQAVQTHAPAYAPCCGAGGGMAQLHPDSAARMARSRLAALAATGAQAVVVSAPECAAHLTACAGPDLPGALPVYGLAEFIAAHCELTRTAGGDELAG